MKSGFENIILLLKLLLTVKTSRSLWLAIPFFVALGSLSLFAAPPAVEALAKELKNLSSLADKIAALTSAASGQSAEVKAELGAALITSLPASEQQQAATTVAQTLTSMTDAPADVPKLASLITAKLPPGLAPQLAPSIIAGAALTNPAQLPQITSAVIVTNQNTINHAADIAGAVTKAAPLTVASSIATAIGAAFSENPALVDKAPQIAASMTSNILPKGTGDLIRTEVSNTVAALTVLLPGSIDNNQSVISRIGAQVAAIISAQSPDLATAIVGVTTTTLKSAAGSSDISTVVTDFGNAFKSSVTDTTIKQQLDTVVTQVNSGNSPYQPITTTSNPQQQTQQQQQQQQTQQQQTQQQQTQQQQQQTPQPTQVTTNPPAWTGNPTAVWNPSTGSLNTAETNVVNK